MVHCLMADSVFVQYCTASAIDRVITSENPVLFGWHKDRGTFVEQY